jgi:hypothetical protein
MACGFDDLLERLRERINSSVRNGEITERGLARSVGLSQPHMHHVLKGERQFRPEVADRVMRVMGLTIADLMQDGGQAPRRPPSSQPLARRATASR